MLKLKDLFVRAVSGAILVAVLIGATLLTDVSRFLILAIVGLMSLREMTGVLCPSNVKSLRWTTMGLALVFIVLFFLGNREILTFATIGYAAAVVVTIRFVAEMFRRSETPAMNIAYDIFAVVYTILPMLLLSTLPPQIIIALFVIVWVNDIGAYLVGVLFGRHRLWERLSPKKSWEGFFGGVLVALGFSIIISYFCQIHETHNLIIWLITALFIAVSGVLGDLFESMLKRSAGIKDSGNVIPGHGGFLDRFDAMLFAAPVMWMIYNLA